MTNENETAGNYGMQRQRMTYLAGIGGIKPNIPARGAALEDAARHRMSAEAFAYIAGGAGEEHTMSANRRAFDRWRIAPRHLRDVSRRELGISLFGHELSAPLVLAPIGVLEMAHADADIGVARAASKENIAMVFSNQASVPMEDAARAMGDGPRWFQLYWSRSNDVVSSFVRRAENCGCSAIVLTLDTTLLGWRPRDLDMAHLPFLQGKGIAQYTSDPAFMSEVDEVLQGVGETDDAPRPPLKLRTLLTGLEQARRVPGGWMTNLRSGRARAAVQHFVATYSRPSLTWKDLAFLRERTRLPVLLKGILTAADARQAVEHGMDGIIVSNHGGRQVDGAVASLDALAEIAPAVKGKLKILFDSGIRGGADAFKALALGADAVCIGRPYAYALGIGGQAGVQELIRNFKADLDLTMGLSGRRAVDEITGDALVREPGGEA